MARSPFSFLALSERFENVVDVIQTSFASSSDRTLDSAYDSAVDTELAAWRACKSPYSRQITAYNSPRLLHDEGSLSDKPTGLRPVVEDKQYNLYYAPGPPVPPKPTRIILQGKILPNIANFEDGNRESDNESFYSFDSNMAEPDLERGPIVLPPAPLENSPRRLNECPPTALSPPPLHHSGRIRNKAVFIPRDTPGTCPIHHCAPCPHCRYKDRRGNFTTPDNRLTYYVPL